MDAVALPKDFWDKLKAVMVKTYPPGIGKPNEWAYPALRRKFGLSLSPPPQWRLGPASPTQPRSRASARD